MKIEKKEKKKIDVKDRKRKGWIKIERKMMMTKKREKDIWSSIEPSQDFSVN